MPEELTTDDYDEAVAHVADHAPTARLMPEISAHLDDAYHTVWLDHGTVWHAWREPDEDQWHLDRETAREALIWLTQQIDGAGVFDRIADPQRYAESIEKRYLGTDEDVMAEYYDVELASLGAEDPREADRLIQGRIDRARAEVSRLSSLRAHHIRTTFQGDGGRGWKAAASRALRISAVAVHDVLKDDEMRAERRREAASRTEDDDN